MKKFFVLIVLLIFASHTSFSQTPQDDEVFLFVQEVPSFPAGDEAMNEFLKKNIKYPELPKGAGKEGAMLASFIVEKNGTLSDVKIVKGMSDALNQEVIRVIKSMPPWIPGMQTGKRVRVEQHITLKFSAKGKLVSAE